MPLSEENAFHIAAYMRIASIAVAGYDYLETLPAAWRFYREHLRSRRLSISVVLFFLVRFTSITVLTISNVVFFYSSFTQESCSRIYLVSPAFKDIQSMVTQAILGVRAFNLSRRSRVVGWLLVTMYIVTCVLQWVTNIYGRTPKVGDPYANCRAAFIATGLGAYMFYVVAIVYDVVTTAMSIFYLLKYKFTASNSVMSKLSKMMLYDGLGYLVALTGINILNLFFYTSSSEIQTAGASLAYCVSWIMAQRLLIHIHDASRQRQEEEGFEAVITVSKNITTPTDINRIARTFNRRGSTPLDFTARRDVQQQQHPAEVQVRIERTVVTNHFTRTYELEDYSRSAQKSGANPVSVL